LLKAPKFWYQKKDTVLSNSLYPLSLLFRFGTKIRHLISKKQRSPLPIICIGNIVVGGAGKTPVSLKIGKLLIKAGYKPHFISKGYSGLVKNSTLVQTWHSARSVGDESILLSEVAPTWVGPDRIFSSSLAKKNGGDCLILDDGFQNPTIDKDFSIIVISAEQEFGNKRVMPSGPLRESIRRGLSRTDLVIVIGDISEDLKNTLSINIPIIEANFEIKKQTKIFKGQNITAFAGIAYPEKFFKSLKEQGAKIVKEISYPDHYIYNENDLLSLAETANNTKSILVSTQKDYVRIPKSYRSLVNTLEGEIVFKNEEFLINLLSNVIENFSLKK
tara:strand:+ start:3515 stop:4507 length:993 start_codon:yes stop_codon:yes gene_type:complete